MDGAREIIPAERKSEVVKFLSDRHFGIGGDGVIFINPSDVADFEMEMYNMDGSRSEMCGNGCLLYTSGAAAVNYVVHHYEEL